jgi:hypothetical protein
MQDPANQRNEIVALRNLNDYIVLMRGMRDSGVSLSLYACVSEAAACVARGILAGMTRAPRLFAFVVCGLNHCAHFRKAFEGALRLCACSKKLGWWQAPEVMQIARECGIKTHTPSMAVSFVQVHSTHGVT